MHQAAKGSGVGGHGRGHGPEPRASPVQHLIAQPAATLALAPRSLEAHLHASTRLESDSGGPWIVPGTMPEARQGCANCRIGVACTLFCRQDKGLRAVSISKSRMYWRLHRPHFSTKQEPCSSARLARRMPERLCSPSTFWLITHVSCPVACSATSACTPHISLAHHSPRKLSKILGFPTRRHVPYTSTNRPDLMRPRCDQALPLLVAITSTTPPTSSPASLHRRQQRCRRC